MSLFERIKELSRLKSLRLTILLAVGLGFLLLATAQYYIAGEFLSRELQEREVAGAYERLEGLQRAILTVGEDLHSTVADWSNWDETYDYVLGNRPQYIDDNVDPLSLTRLRLSFLVIVDEQQRVRYAIQQPAPFEPLVPLQPERVQALATDPILAPPGRSYTGLFAMGGAIYLISSQPVERSVPTHAPKGRLIMARALSCIVPSIGRISSMGVSIVPPALSSSLAGAKVHRRGLHTVHAVSDATLEGYTQLLDSRGQPIAVLHATINRPAQSSVHTARWWLLAATLLIATACCFVSIWYIERKVVKPISGLAQQLEHVTEAPDALLRVAPMDTAAELSVLGKAINNMLGTIEAQQKLRQEHDAVVRANQIKSEFIATMSHEIRTPMNGVLGMCELLQRTELDARQRKLTDTILRSGRSLLAILNDVLDYSKIEAGKIELTKSEFCLPELIDAVLATFSAEAQNKNVVLDSELAPEMPTRLIGDQQRLRQVLLNLVNNAVKFTAKGRVRVTCSLDSVAGSQVHVRFDVSDTGIGIAPAMQARIFEPFEQAQNPAQKDSGGTGLGLAISRRLVMAMGGEIGVHSRPNEGATFSFTVELERVAAVAAPVLPMLSTSLQFTPSSAPSVLLVEDNIVNREVVNAMLEQMNCKVTAVENGAQALEACQRERFDVIMMDCEMPVMDGHAAAMKIREWERSQSRGEMPIVALTANVTTVNKQRCFDSGMNGFLTKPVSQARLSLALVQALRGALRPRVA